MVSSRLKRVLGKFSCVSSGGEKAVNRDVQPTQSVRRSPTPPSTALELELAKQRAECARLEREYQRTKAEADGFAEAKGKLEVELQEVKELLEARGKEVDQKDTSNQQLESKMVTELNELRTTLAHARARLTEKEAEVDGFAETKGKLEDELREVKALLEAQGKEVGQKDTNNQRLENEMGAKLNELRSALAHAHARLSEKDRLLSERTAELSAAEAFLTKVDAVSEVQAVSMVKNLNTLISSASSALSVTWDQQEPVPGTPVDEPSFKQVRDYFGNSMFEEVAARNPVAVTLAFEMHLVQFVEQVTSGWGGGAAGGVLGEIYGMISTAESQAMASRWRVLTKRYTPHRESPPKGEEIINNLALILMITRTCSDFSEAAEFVETSAGTEVNAIVEATLRFDNAIKTKVISSDMSVYVVPPGTAFTGETMVDGSKKEGGEEEEGEHGIVAGTTEIGLLQRMGNVETVLLKPKVILERDLPEPDSKW